MLPYIVIFGSKLYVFPIIILMAIFFTLLYFIVSPKYSLKYNSEFMHAFLPIAIGSAIGARLTSAIILIFQNGYSLLQGLLFGGSVYYGGLIGGCISLCIYCNIKKYSFVDYADAYASILPLGHAIGRVGCFLNGCCYGKEYHGIFAINYPIDGVYVSIFPTWFFEIIINLCLFFYFQFFCKNKEKGYYIGTYLIIYPLNRFIIEFMRGDEIRGSIGCFSTSQWISMALIVIGFAFQIYRRKFKGEYNKFIVSTSGK